MLICDAETRKPVDMLPGRDQATVSDWLRAHQETKQISRDRYAPFREAIESTVPDVIHVLDRFHLVQNVWKIHKSVIHALLPRFISLAENEQQEPVVLPPPTTKLQRVQQRRRDEKWQRALRVQSMFAAGQTKSSIARELVIHRQTVQRDLLRQEPMDTTRERSPTSVASWWEMIEKLEREHKTMKEIYEQIYEHGYRGSFHGV